MYLLCTYLFCTAARLYLCRFEQRCSIRLLCEWCVRGQSIGSIVGAGGIILLPSIGFPAFHSTSRISSFFGTCLVEISLTVELRLLVIEDSAFVLLHNMEVPVHTWSKNNKQIKLIWILYADNAPKIFVCKSKSGMKWK
jgi:hypothetical protein